MSDALINDATFEFLKNRSPESTIMLSNAFQTFQSAPAVRLRDETEFLNKLMEHCKDGKPFLFGSDSCDVVSKFYHRCLDSVSDEALKAKFIHITVDTAVRVKGASTEFKDKYVFISQTNNFGVDFSIATAQDMFIYIYISKAAQLTQPGCINEPHELATLRRYTTVVSVAMVSANTIPLLT